MKQSAFFKITAIEYGCVGLALLIFPAPALSLLGVDLDSGGALPARFFGSAIVGAAVILWMSKTESFAEANPIFLGNLLYNLLMIPVLLSATLQHTMGPLGWVAMAVHVIFAVGFAQMTARGRRSAHASVLRAG